MLGGIPSAQQRMLGAIALAIPLSGISAIYPANTWLQIGPVLLGLPIAVWALRRWPISDRAALCLAGFVLLHLFAARWTYSSVPYERWFAALGIDSFNAAFGFQRNMFDRLVHFLFGVLAMVPAAEIARRYGGLGPRQGLAFGLLFVLAMGGLYEIFEWSLTMTLSPEDAGAYNGEQGDIFDGQKDMALAALGALLALPWALPEVLARR